MGRNIDAHRYRPEKSRKDQRGQQPRYCRPAAQANQPGQADSHHQRPERPDGIVGVSELEMTIFDSVRAA